MKRASARFFYSYFLNCLASMSTLLDLYKVVLVEPQNPINVGNVIRAMKNMGLKRLALVNPAEMDLQRTQISAHRTEDMLESLEICETLDEALADVHESCGFSARHRTQTWASLEMEEAVGKSLCLAHRGQRTAFVFGREQTGLTNEELMRCSCRVHIATSAYSSLNLSQAVLLACYSLQRQWRGLEGAVPANPSVSQFQNHAPGTRPATQDERIRLMKSLEDALVEIGYFKSPDPNTAVHRVQNIITRAELHNDEYHLLMGMLAEIRNYAKLMSRGIEPRRLRPAKSYSNGSEISES